jgi:hypothetical protein
MVTRTGVPLAGAAVVAGVAWTWIGATVVVGAG